MHDMPTRHITLGGHVVDWRDDGLCVDDRTEMTFYWPAMDRCDGADFVICVE
jgi:hypothetical protein